MAWIVGVLERNAVIRDGVLGILETAEVRLTLTQPHAVRIDAEGAGGHLDDLVEICERRCEVLDELSGDFSSCGNRIQRVSRWRQLRSDGSGRFDGDGLRQPADAEGDRKILRYSSFYLNPAAAGRESRRRHLYDVGTGGEAADREGSLSVRGQGTRDTIRGSHGHGGPGNRFPGLVDNGSGDYGLRLSTQFKRS